MATTKKTTAKKATTSKPEKAPEEAAKAEPVKGSDQKAVAVKEAPGQLALSNVDPEIVERINELREALESFDNLRLPVIKFGKEGFQFLEGEEPQEEFSGVMIFTKKSNVYYEKSFKAGQNLPPDCFSTDGVTPDDSLESPKASKCADCPMNQFGSSPTGEGKACKNTRPTFFLVGGSLLPMALRIPPTSLKNIQKYVMSVASRYGSYYAVRTKVMTYKEQQEQEYLHIKFAVDGRVPAEIVRDEDGEIVQLGRNEIKGIRAQTLELMKSGNFGIDEQSAEEPAQHPEPPPPDASTGSSPQF